MSTPILFIFWATIAYLWFKFTPPVQYVNIFFLDFFLDGVQSMGSAKNPQ